MSVINSNIVISIAKVNQKPPIIPNQPFAIGLGFLIFVSINKICAVFFMKVSTTEPFQIVYSLLQHEYFGFLFEPFVVQINHKGELTYQFQTISPKNTSEFAAGLDATDFELVRLMGSIHQDTILKKFNPKKLSIVDFFARVYNPTKPEKLLQEAISEHLENVRAQILELLTNKKLSIMSKDGDPTRRLVELPSERARVFFHFVRNETDTHYFPIIKYKGKNLEFQYKNAFLICDEPAWLMVGNQLYNFERNVDGKKIRPFLSKKFIVIPKNLEDQYYHKFVAPLVAAYDVFARGFEIKYETATPTAILTLSETKSVLNTPSLFANGSDIKDKSCPESQIILDLSFQYGSFNFKFDSFAANANVKIEKNGDEYVFHKVRRDVRLEKNRILFLKERHLDLKQGRCTIPKAVAFAWVHQHGNLLEESGFLLRQNTTNDKHYFLGYSSIEVIIKEDRDWFDLHATVRFGDFEVPFLTLRELILNKKREFTLPNGEIAVIPEVWFSTYAELFCFSELNADQLILKKHHIALVQAMEMGQLATTVMSRKLRLLNDFSEIEPAPAPAGLRGTLRPYQQSGYDWLCFLNKCQLGGCLADDMGLGKTLQTLALLQAQKEAGATEPSLIVMPTSLLYNWEAEARKFTPDLKVMCYTGTYRDKNPAQFSGFDIVLTSYGIVRLDIEQLENYRFNYVILDESQAIKNPSSGIAKAVMQFNARNRLILTGTPLENTTMDLWTQMTFVNPGLLGSQSFFKLHFQQPIEKQADQQQLHKLNRLIKPFLLRRHKSQVAVDLPPKVESVQYCEMTDAQSERYEETKSYFRNLILERIEADGMAKSQMIVLQGLTKLRQLANHPRMVETDYEADSGKLDAVLEKLETIISENSKVLIFSQFTKHLAIIRQVLEQRNINYAYLDGSTTNRQQAVDLFQNDASVQVFLVSLKAGGVGLNLTAAEYVFVLDPWWNPASEAQAIDRAHRIGQQKTVFAYKFITKNTVEEKIMALQRTKQKLFNDLITTEEGFVKSLTKEDLMTLLD